MVQYMPSTNANSTEASTIDSPARIKLLKGYRWPKARCGSEIDVGDYLLCVIWNSYPTARFAKVVRITKTGKVWVETVRTDTKDKTTITQEIKECGVTTLLSRNMINAIMLDKLSSE
jgi:hypothetical protein